MNAKRMGQWEAHEEADIQKLMATGLDRIKAIQLWKRCGKNLEKALEAATRPRS